MIGGSWRRRLRLLLTRDRATRELEEEMCLHRELRAEQLQAAGARESDAHAQARRRFGNVTGIEEASRDQWGFASLESLLHDVRYAARRLRQRPGFTAAVVIVLALGIGATTAMFSAVDAAMLRPLPFPHPEQLVTLPDLNIPFDPGPGQQYPKSDTHRLDINDVNAMPNWFSSAAGYAVGGLNLSDPESPARLTVGVVTANFFSTLGISSAIGRTFSADEGRPGHSHVALLSWGLWQRQFGGRPMISRTIVLNTSPYTIVGVMPKGFAFPEQSELWIPMTIPTTFETFEAFRQYLPSSVLARLAPGVTPASASRQLLARWRQGLAPGLSRESNGKGYIHEELDDFARRGTMFPLQLSLVGDRQTALILLLGATGLLLLIACANVANLLLSQGNARRREVAVREVLGATRQRIVGQLLAESILLAATGAAFGLALAPAALRVISRMMPAGLAGVATPTINLRILLFAALLAVVIGVAVGIWPALGASGGDLSGTIKSGGGHGATGGTLGRSRQVLTGAELALTVMLLIGAGLMLRSFRHLLSSDTGMNVEHVGTLRLAFPRALPPARNLAEIDAILERLRATPGVSAAGAVNNLPLGGGGGILLRVTPTGSAPPANDDEPGALDLIAAPGYFRAMGITIIAGRDFASSDRPGGRPVAIISAAVAHRFWPGESPVGRTFGSGSETPTTVVGVVADVRELHLDQDPVLQMYSPMAQQTPPNVAIVARGTMAPGALLTALRGAVRSVDPTQAVYAVRTMDDVLNQSLAPRRTNTLLISIFAALAFVLAAVGVGAVVSYGVTQRRRELGIRAALGASGSQLMTLLSREMAMVAAIGVLAGLAGAWALAHLMSSLIYGVTIHDPVTFVAVPAVLLTAAAVATFVPARRALRVNPVEVMRAE
ncbi:MAG: ADOP family duplicated permease [Gemmatimonadales bacterium]